MISVIFSLMQILENKQTYKKGKVLELEKTQY